MQFTTFLIMFAVSVTVRAHFQLSFPQPRGAFDEDNEIHFCGQLLLSWSRLVSLNFDGMQMVMTIPLQTELFSQYVFFPRNETSFNLNHSCLAVSSV